MPRPSYFVAPDDFPIPDAQPSTPPPLSTAEIAERQSNAELTPSLRPPEQAEGRKPILWLGNVAQPSAAAVEAAYAKGNGVVRMFVNACERFPESAFERTLLTWAYAPADGPTTAKLRAAKPKAHYQIDNLFPVVVAFRRTASAWEAHTVVYRLEWRAGLFASRLAGRTVFSPDGSSALAGAPAFGEVEAVEIAWAHLALTGIRLLCDALYGNLAVTPPLPTFRCRTAVETDDGRTVPGWGPPDTLIVPADPEREVQAADVRLSLPGCGRDRYVRSKEWIEVPDAPPWGVVDDRLFDHDGTYRTVQVCSDVSILTLNSVEGN